MYSSTHDMYVTSTWRYSYALFEAVDHCSDGIEITTPESDGKIVVSQCVCSSLCGWLYKVFVIV